jgi:hypothetical protein
LLTASDPSRVPQTLLGARPAPALDETTALGETALQFACANGHVRSVRLLLTQVRCVLRDAVNQCTVANHGAQIIPKNSIFSKFSRTFPCLHVPLNSV